MSEMEWENPPEVRVPMVRNWIGPAFDAWARAVYPPRRSITIVWGCLFIVPWALWQCLKLAIFAAGIVLMLFANVAWIPAELITYRHRYKRAVLAAHGPYMGELYGETP